MRSNIKELKEINILFDKSKGYRDTAAIYIYLSNFLYNKGGKEIKACSESIKSAKALSQLVDKIIIMLNQNTRNEKLMRDFKRQFQLHKDHLSHFHNLIELFFHTVFDNKDSITKNLLNVQNLYTVEEMYIFKVFNKYRNVLIHSNGETFINNTSEKFLYTTIPNILEDCSDFLYKLFNDHKDVFINKYNESKNSVGNMKIANMGKQRKR